MYSSFKEMPVWQNSMSIAEEIFKFTEELPRKEDFGFTSQIRRAALSIPANIAEAFARESTKDKNLFYYYARGSASEALSHLEYAHRVGYIDKNKKLTLDQRLESIIYDLNKIVVSIKTRSATSNSKSKLKP